MSASLPAIVLLAAMTLTACGGQVVPSPTPARLATPEDSETSGATPVPLPATPDPAARPESRTAYAEAICPPFEAIALLDPRLAALRAAGAAGDDVTTHGAEIDLVAEELRVILNDLATVPDWTPGAVLRNEVSAALHDLRISLLDASDRLTEADGADQLAAVPYIARPMIDQGIQRAVDAGFECSFQ